MKKRSKLWTELDPSAPPAEPTPKASLGIIFAKLTEGVDQEPTEEELAELTERLRRAGLDEAADAAEAKPET